MFDSEFDFRQKSVSLLFEPRQDKSTQIILSTLKQHEMLAQISIGGGFVSALKPVAYRANRETIEHCERVAVLAESFGRILWLGENQLAELTLFSILHDIGKFYVDNRLLQKPGKLSDTEWAQIKQHPQIGYRILLETPQFKDVAQDTLCHHERYDGNGYPNGLHGKEIPLLARILSIVDAYDAMTADRPYRKAMSTLQAIDEIEKNAGTQFDPALARAFVRSFAERPNVWG